MNLSTFFIFKSSLSKMTLFAICLAGFSSFTQAGLRDEFSEEEYRVLTLRQDQPLRTLGSFAVSERSGRSREDLIKSFADSLERYQEAPILVSVEFEWAFFKEAIAVLEKKSHKEKGEPFTFNFLQVLKIRLSKTQRSHVSWKDFLALMPKLEELHLSDNKTKLEETFHTLKGVSLGELKQLNLSLNALSAAEIKILKTMGLPKLEKLNLGGNQLGGDGMKVLSTLDLKNLTHLTLKDNAIGDAGIGTLIVMDLPNLRYLALSRNSIGDEGMKSFSKADEFSCLAFLDLNGNSIGDAGIEDFSKMDLSNLDHLNLKYNRITLKGMKALSKMKLPNLKSLFLDLQDCMSDKVHALFEDNPNFPKLRKLN